MGNSNCETGTIFSLSLLLLVLILSTTSVIGGSSMFNRIIYAAAQLQDKASNTTTINDIGPNAQMVHQTESMNVPRSVGTFVWYIVDKPMKILLHNPGSMLVITMPSIFQLILLFLKVMLSPSLMPMLHGIPPILIR